MNNNETIEIKLGKRKLVLMFLDCVAFVTAGVYAELKLLLKR